MRFGNLCEVESAGHNGGTMLVSEEEAVLEEAKTRRDGEGGALL